MNLSAISESHRAARGIDEGVIGALASAILVFLPSEKLQERLLWHAPLNPGTRLNSVETRGGPPC